MISASGLAWHDMYTHVSIIFSINHLDDKTTNQIGLSWILNLNRFLPNSLPTTLCVTSGRVEFTDDCISEWTCGGGGQVITTWSHSRSEKRGTHTVCTARNTIKRVCKT